MTRKWLSTVTVAALAALVVAAPAPVNTTGTVKDRENFIPRYKFQALPGKAVGLLLSDVAPKMNHEGRYGAVDNMGFSSGGFSYRWVYVPAQGRAEVGTLTLPVGEKGAENQVFANLSMANARTVAQWDIKVPHALVEVEVNAGKGSPAQEGFAATKMTRLDGTKEYPLNVAEVMGELRKKYATWKTEQQAKLDEAMAEAQKKAIKDRKPTGPRESNELVYATWLPETKKMRVHFRTTLTDGDYKYSDGGAAFDRDPPALPLPPIKRPLPPVPQQAPAPQVPQGFAAFPPPPPRDLPRVRYGTSFGIEFGLAYEVSHEGRITRTEVLTPQAFSNELPPPPAVRFPRQPFELPPPPRQ